MSCTLDSKNRWAKLHNLRVRLMERKKFCLLLTVIMMVPPMATCVMG